MGGDLLKILSLPTAYTIDMVWMQKAGELFSSGEKL